MTMCKYLSSMIKVENLELKEELNLTDEESLVYDELSKGRSVISIADKLCVSTSTVDSRIKDIRRKIEKFEKRV